MMIIVGIILCIGHLSRFGSCQIYNTNKTIIAGSVLVNSSKEVEPFFYYELDYGYIFHPLTVGSERSAITRTPNSIDVNDPFYKPSKSYNIETGKAGSVEGKIKDIKVISTAGKTAFVIVGDVKESGTIYTLMVGLNEELEKLTLWDIVTVQGSFYKLYVLRGGIGYLLLLQNPNSIYACTSTLSVCNNIAVGYSLAKCQIAGNLPNTDPVIFGIFCPPPGRLHFYNLNTLEEVAYGASETLSEEELQALWEQIQDLVWIGGNAHIPTLKLTCLIDSLLIACTKSVYTANESPKFPAPLSFLLPSNTIIPIDFIIHDTNLQYTALPYYGIYDLCYRQINFYTTPLSAEILFTQSSMVPPSTAQICLNFIYKKYEYPEMLFMSKCGSDNSVEIFYSRPTMSIIYFLLQNSVELYIHFFPDIPYQSLGIAKSCTLTISTVKEPLITAEIFTSPIPASEINQVISEGTFGSQTDIVNYKIKYQCWEDVVEANIDIILLDITPSLKVTFSAPLENQIFSPNEGFTVKATINPLLYTSINDFHGTLSIEYINDQHLTVNVHQQEKIPKKDLLAMTIPSNLNLSPRQYQLCFQIGLFILTKTCRIIEIAKVHDFDFEIISHEASSYAIAGQDLNMEIVFLPSPHPSSFSITTKVDDSYTIITTNSLFIIIAGVKLKEEKKYKISMSTNMTEDNIRSVDVTTFTEAHVVSPRPWAEITKGEDLEIKIAYSSTITTILTLKNEIGEPLYTITVIDQLSIQIPGTHLQLEENYEIILDIVTLITKPTIKLFVTARPPAPKLDNSDISVDIITSNTLPKYSSSISHRFLCKTTTESPRRCLYMEYSTYYSLTH